MVPRHIRGINSVVECHLAKVKVASPNLVSRSKDKAHKALYFLLFSNMTYCCHSHDVLLS